ncbi:MAG: diguanylate cyclase [Gaiellaceae bacterium]
MNWPSAGPPPVTTLLIGLSAALALGVIILVVRLGSVARGSSRRADQLAAEAVAALGARMDALSRELAGAVARTDEESRRNRYLGELAGSIDLDEVLARTLEAAEGLAGVDAALVTMRSHEGKPIIATLGLSAAEAERQAIAGPPDGRKARSIAITYRYSAAEQAADDGLIHSGVAVPMADDTGGELGLLTVFARSRSKVFGEDDVARLEGLAARAGPAIANARRFREARRLADLDALTGLHNRRYFHETLARECARAHRYARKLALIVFDLDDFKEVNDRIGHLAGDAVLAAVSERVREVVRSADIACRVGGDEFAVILPESTLSEGDQLYQRIEEAVAARPLGPGGSLHLSAGVAELRREDDAVSFFQRADDALYQAKELGKGRAVNADSG